MPRTWKNTIFLMSVMALMSLVPAVMAQEPIPEDADPAAGVQLFQQRCANCHGPLGLGDGELAANLPNMPTAIGSAEYLDSADPAVMFQVIQNGNIAAGMPGFGAGNNSDPLDAVDIWNVIAGLGELSLLNRPIETAVVTGQVFHAQEIALPSDLSIVLQGFDRSANETFRQEIEVDESGQYQFDLQSIPPDWIFRASALYQGIDFTSSVVQIDPFSPEVDLPITLFETTTSDENLRVSRLSILVEFLENAVQFAEVYSFDNRSLTVYTGSTGNPEDGTITVTVPDGAISPLLVRSIESSANLVPLDQIETAAGDLQATVAVAPGPGAVTLIMRYEVPQSDIIDADGLFTRQINYDADIIEMILPDTGVELDGGSWQSAGPIDALLFPDALPRVRYEHTAVTKGGQLAIPLTGWPDLVSDVNGNLIINRNPTQELWIGAIVLAVIAIVVGGTAYRWTQLAPEQSDREQLLSRLAALEEAYELNELPQGAYRRRKQQLVQAIKALSR